MQTETQIIFDINEMRFNNLIESINNYLKDTEDDILGCTTQGQNDELIIPSIYFQDNEFFNFIPTIAIHGLGTQIYSFKKNVVFGLQMYNSPFLSNYDDCESLFCEFLTIKRESILDFTIEKDKKYIAVKPKKGDKIGKFFSSNWRLMSRSGFIGAALLQLTGKGISALANKIGDDTIEQIGVMFHLNYIDNGERKRIDIACEKWYADDFEIMLQSQWKPTAEPMFIPETTEDKRKYNAMKINVGDTVLIPKFFRTLEGTVIEKNEKTAKIRIVKKGTTTIETVDYLDFRKKY